MSVKLQWMAHWPFVAVRQSAPAQAAERALKRFAQAEQRLNGHAPDRLKAIETKASDIVRLADDMIEEAEERKA